MSGQYEAIMSALSEIRSTQLEQVEKTAKVEAHVEALAGPKGRVTSLENHNTRQWWLTVAITPLLLVVHAMSRKLGLDI